MSSQNVGHVAFTGKEISLLECGLSNSKFDWNFKTFSDVYSVSMPFKRGFNRWINCILLFVFNVTVISALLKCGLTLLVCGWALLRCGLGYISKDL